MFQSKTLEDNISLPDDDDNGIGLISSKEVNYFLNDCNLKDGNAI
jgi:hypothetical protein